MKFIKLMHQHDIKKKNFERNHKDIRAIFANFFSSLDRIVISLIVTVSLTFKTYFGGKWLKICGPLMAAQENLLLYQDEIKEYLSVTDVHSNNLCVSFSLSSVVISDSVEFSLDKRPITLQLIGLCMLFALFLLTFLVIYNIIIILCFPFRDDDRVKANFFVSWLSFWFLLAVVIFIIIYKEMRMLEGSIDDDIQMMVETYPLTYGLDFFVAVLACCCNLFVLTCANESFLEHMRASHDVLP